MRMPGKVTLAQFVAATLVTATTLLLVALGTVGWRAEAKRQRVDLARLSNVQADGLAVALAVPVWNIDRAVIGKILDAMAQPKSIYGICVTAGDDTIGRRRNAKWELVPWDGVGAPRELAMQERPIVYQGSQIGVVDLYVTSQFVDKDLRRLLWETAGTIVAVDLLIIVSVYFVLWRAVLRPVTDIERYAGAVSTGVRRQIAAPVSAGSAPELESLSGSIQSMVNLLQLREERFRSIFESANDAIFILDAENAVILDVNARLYDLFGYEHDTIDFLDLGVISAGVLPYTLDDAVAHVRSLQPGDRQIFEWRARHKDGHLFWVEISLRKGVIGNLMCVVSVVRDIEERKTMEEKLRHSETMSAMGNVVAGVAHEVRNPLFGIAATLDAFEAEFGGGQDLAEYLTTLRNDVSRLSRLMRDLLDYGRPQQTERRAQSIAPIVAEAVRVCAPRAKERRIEIREEIDDELPEVSMNADRMLQVFKNVVENAVEFSKVGEAVLLRVRRDDNGAAAIVCTVADRGPGFRPEDLPHIFEPFFTRRAGGSGLGLAIVQKIVGEHGGTITAGNGAGGGGVVEIRLPAISATTSRTGSPPSP
ncbi:MAG TPA: ATP-binding protein [Thermoanaerobaculia bacterium]|nr:ATP-binding protein [Thermoanaerobaculia bacterium]